MADCYIYVIGVEDGPVKVGISSMPRARLATIQTGCHFKIDLLYHRKCRSRDHALKNERILHRVYAEKRLVGEWFDLDMEIAVELIEGSFETEAYFEQEERDEYMAARLNLWPWAGEDYGTHTHH